MKANLLIIIVLLGLLALFIISNNLPIKNINSPNELKLNELVSTNSKIKSMKTFDSFSIITLENNISLTCNCKFPVNSTVYVSGKVVEYKNNLQISAMNIKVT